MRKVIVRRPRRKERESETNVFGESFKKPIQYLHLGRRGASPRPSFRLFAVFAIVFEDLVVVVVVLATMKCPGRPAPRTGRKTQAQHGLPETTSVEKNFPANIAYQV